MKIVQGTTGGKVMNYGKWMILGIVSTSIVLTGCGKEKSSSEHESHSHHEIETTADIREETKSNEILPTFLDDKDENMKVVYRSVGKHKELLEKIPCYCGCGDTVGHTSSYDCFIYENKVGGAVVWDDHATRCGICLDIAAQSVIEYSQGKSIKQIRNDIDEKYKKGYGKPTPTPKI